MILTMGKPKTIMIETERMLLVEHTPELYKYLFDSCESEQIKNTLGCIDDAAFNKECERYNAGMTSYQLSFKNFLMTDKVTGVPIGFGFSVGVGAGAAAFFTIAADFAASALDAAAFFAGAALGASFFAGASAFLATAFLAGAALAPLAPAAP